MKPVYSVLIMLCLCYCSSSVTGQVVLPKGKTVLETFDCSKVRLLDSKWKTQQDATKDYSFRIPNDDLLKGFRLTGTRNDDSGKFSVTLDGKDMGEVDQYGKVRGVPFEYKLTDLKPGDHTVTIKVLVEKNKDSRSNIINYSTIEKIYILFDYLNAPKSHVSILNFPTIPQWMYITPKPVIYPKDADEVCFNYS